MTHSRDFGLAGFLGRGDSEGLVAFGLIVCDLCREAQTAHELFLKSFFSIPFVFPLGRFYGLVQFSLGHSVLIPAP